METHILLCQLDFVTAWFFCFPKYTVNTAVRLLQFLLGLLYNQDNASGGTRAVRSLLERGGIGENSGRILRASIIRGEIMSEINEGDIVQSKFEQVGVI